VLIKWWSACFYTMQCRGFVPSLG